MNRRKELCRNFQRGYCSYGERCKFIHATPQQPKPNPFESGVQNNFQATNTSQQQKPNIFGFGVQNNKPSSSSFNTTTKPFENKWVRPGSTNSTLSQQPQKQQPAAIHKCTDPESCKLQIIEDFKNEAPLWKLTCYGHRKDGPCEITGDISFEELRAAAYEDARRGLSVQSIVEKERSLYLSKLSEFENLLKNPYLPKNSSFSGMKQSPMAANNGSLPGVQNNVEQTPTFSSFSQLGTATSFAPSNRNFPSASGNATVFGRPNSSQGGSQNSSGFGMFGNSGVQTQLAARSSTSPNNPVFTGSNNIGYSFPSASGNATVFGQPNSSQVGNQNSSGFGMKFGNSGVQTQLTAQPFGSSTSPNNPVFPGGNSIGSSFPPFNQQFGGLNDQQKILTGTNIAKSTVHQATVMDNNEPTPYDSIWLKEKWEIGEIPEVPPPDRFCK